jgi:DNA-directed RNA polymerase alpha subunit
MSQQEGRRVTNWDKWLDVSVENLDLPCPIVRRLANVGILTVGHLGSITEEDLRRIYWFGKGSIERVNWALAQVNLPPLPKHIPHQPRRHS